MSKNLIKNQFYKNGFLILKNILNDYKYIKTCSELNLKVNKYLLKYNLKNLGGYLSGNLNFDPGIDAWIIWKHLKIKLSPYFQKITNKKISDFDIIVGGNINFPSSSDQHIHADGNFNPRIIVINIPLVQINEMNGPTEIFKKSHKEWMPYWKFFFIKKSFSSTYLKLDLGDVAIREHRLWHRGTKNKSNKARAMLAFVLKEKSLNNNEYDNKVKLKKSSNRIRIYPNWFSNSLYGKIVEIIYKFLPKLYSCYRFIRSFFVKKYKYS